MLKKLVNTWQGKPSLTVQEWKDKDKLKAKSDESKFL